MSDPSGPQLAGIQSALLAAFPTRDALAQMLLFQLGVTLNHLAGEGIGLQEVTYQLLVWARAEGRLAELVMGAQTANPGNPELRALPPVPQPATRNRQVILLPPRPPDPWAPRPEFAPLKQALLAGGPTALVTEGRGGLGKTALAQKLAWDADIRAAYPVGVFWITFGQTPDILGALARLGSALGEDVSSIGTVGERAAVVQALLTDKACLCVWDDVWQADVAHLVKDLGPAAALLTTREHDVARVFAPRADTRLAHLDAAAATDLLRALVTMDVPEAELARTAAVADGLPLTLTLLAPLLDDEVQLGLGLDIFLTQIERQEWRGRELAKQNEIIAKSLDALPAEDHPAFVQLAVFGARPATFDLPAVAAVWDVDEARARARLSRLVARNLLDAAGGGRFSLHQSLADVAAMRLPTTAPAYSRHAQYYLDYINRDRDDWRAIDTELTQIRCAWEAVVGNHEQTLAFIWAMHVFQNRQGYWREEISWTGRGLAAAQALGQREAEATLLNNLAWACNALGERQQALAYYARAMSLFEAVGDRAGQARTLNNIGEVFRALRDGTQALAYYERALPLREAIGDRAGQAITLDNIAQIYSAQGDYKQAKAYSERALPLFQALGAHADEAVVLNNIGEVYRAQGDGTQALAYYERALPLFEAVGDRAGQATTLNNIGLVYDALRDGAQALAYLARALPLREALGDHAGQATTLNNIGLVYNGQGDYHRAIAYLARALPLFEAMGDRVGQATTLTNIGAIYRALRAGAQALAYFARALPLFEAAGDRAGQAATLTNIGEVFRVQGIGTQALAYYERALPLFEAVGDCAGQAATLNNIGLVYDALRDGAQALAYFARALPLFETAGDHVGRRVTLFNMVGVYYVHGHRAEAVHLLEQIVALEKARGLPELAHHRAMLEQIRAELAAQALANASPPPAPDEGPAPYLKT